MDIERYTTSDLYEAAFLYAADSNSFTGLEGTGRVFSFIFSGNAPQRNSKEYYSREASVVAKDYADAIRTLKDVIFTELRKQEREKHSYDR